MQFEPIQKGFFRKLPICMYPILAQNDFFLARGPNFGPKNPKSYFNQLWLILCTYSSRASNPCEQHCHQCGTKFQPCPCCWRSPSASRRQSLPLRQKGQVLCHLCQWLWQCQILVHTQSQWNGSGCCCPRELGFSELGRCWRNNLLGSWVMWAHQFLPALLPMMEKEKNLKTGSMIESKRNSTYSIQDANHALWHFRRYGKGHGQFLWHC